MDTANYKDILAHLEVGDKIYWIGQKRPYAIKARDERYIICTQPCNFHKSVMYSIIDTEELICAPNNLVFNPYNYKKQEDIEQSLNDLEKGEYELSYRHRANFIKCFDRFKKDNDNNIISFTQEGAAVLSLNSDKVNQALDEAYHEYKKQIENQQKA